MTIRKRSIRILHLNLSTGGLGRYGALYAKALSKRKDVDVLSVFSKTLIDSTPLQKITDELKILQLPCQSITDRAKLAFSLRKIINSWSPDIIHDTSGSGHTVGAFAVTLSALDSPCLFTEHDPVPHMGMGSSLLSRISRFLIRRFGAHIFVHGPLGKQQLINQGVNFEKVTVIRHGILSPLFDNNARQKVIREPKRVLFFGALRPNKGLELLVPIADKIYEKHPDVKFVIAGSPAVSKELIRSDWLRKLNIILDEMSERSYIDVQARFIPDEEVASLFKKASIVLLPYLDATQSGVVMIAMPMGCVVLATNVGDIPFVIDDGVTGFLSEPQVENISNRLDYALSHLKEVEKIRESARAWVYNECRWEYIVDQSLDVYNRFSKVNR